MNRFFSRQIVGLMLLVIASVAMGFGGNAPATQGHSPDEVQLRLNTGAGFPYSVDCTPNNTGEDCYAECPKPNERAIGGNCITSTGLAFAGYGITDAASGQKRWECYDSSHGFDNYLRAQVICLEVG